MRLLMLPPYCHPEQVSSSHLTNDLYEAFADADMEVEVFAPLPCRGVDKETREKYKAIKTEKYNDSVTIHRFSLYAEGKNSFFRAFRYVLCNLIQIYKGSRAKNIDLLYSSSTPPTQGLMMARVKKKLSKQYGYSVPFVYNLQDVFPDSLVNAKMTSKGSLLWKIGRIIEDRTYKNADKIIVISDEIKNNIIKKGVQEGKIIVIPNWVNTRDVIPIARNENTLFDELGIGRDEFIVVYAGNLGKAQGIDTIIDAAKQIGDVKFLIFGDGSSREEYEERCKGCKNIHMFPLMPQSRISEVYSMGDMCLVACKKGTGLGAVPSKSVSIMATATPVLLCYDESTGLWDLVTKNNCGLCSPAGDVHRLIENIRFAKKNHNLLVEMGKNARQLVEKNYSASICTKKYIMEIKKTIDDFHA